MDVEGLLKDTNDMIDAIYGANGREEGVTKSRAFGSAIYESSDVCDSQEGFFLGLWWKVSIQSA